MPGVRRSTVLLAVAALLATSCGPGLFFERTGARVRWSQAARRAGPDPTAVAVARFFARRGRGLSSTERAAAVCAVLDESRRAGLSPTLVVAVIEVESGGDRFAVSSAGALGLMQLLPTTAEAVAARSGVPWRGPETLFDPVANVRLGVRYLAELHERFGSVPTALAAYNWGPTHIARRRAGGRALPVVYPTRVLSAVERLSTAA